MFKVETEQGTVEVPRCIEVARTVEEYVDARTSAPAEEPVLEGVPFASSVARQEAEAAGLDAWDFHLRPQGSPEGYTAKDVRQLAGDQATENGEDAGGDGAGTNTEQDSGDSQEE